MKKAASACKSEGLQTDVCHMYTEHLLPIKNRLLNTLTYSIVMDGRRVTKIRSFTFHTDGPGGHLTLIFDRLFYKHCIDFVH